MAYSTLGEVKALLRITDASHDTEITALIDDADAKIDNKLQNYEATLPLTLVPGAINKSSKYLAAAFYLKLSPLSEIMKAQADVFDKIGLEFLTEYIIEKYHAGTIQ